MNPHSCLLDCRTWVRREGDAITGKNVQQLIEHHARLCRQYRDWSDAGHRIGDGSKRPPDPRYLPNTLPEVERVTAREDDSAPDPNPSTRFGIRAEQDQATSVEADGTHGYEAGLKATFAKTMNQSTDKPVLDDLQIQLALGCCRSINGGPSAYIMERWIKETAKVRNLTPAIIDQVVRFHAERFDDHPEVFTFPHGTYWMAQESGIPLDWSPGEAEWRLNFLKERLQKEAGPSRTCSTDQQTTVLPTG